MTLTLNTEYRMPSGPKVKVIYLTECRARVKYIDGKENHVNGRTFFTFPELDISPESELTPITTTEGALS